jgi:CRP-like cAMP-binding protein
MVMTLRTGVVLNGEVIMDARTVAQRYLHSWFIVDLMSNFPLALFVSSSGKSIKIVKLQKIPKLLRVRRLLKYLREYAKYYNLTISFLALVFGLHLFACIWASLFNECFGPGDIQNCDDSDVRLSLSLFTLSLIWLARLITDVADLLTSTQFGSMYMQSIHTVMLMFLGIGESTSYARIARLRDPATDATTELYAASLAVFLVGNVFASFLFGNVLALLMSWDQQKAQFRNRMDIISAEMKYYELPEDLQHRVRRNYDYLWINQRAYSDMMLLNQPGISKPLRTTIALHLYKDLVKTVPFFAGSDARFLGKVCLALETAVYLPGDTIIYYDEIGKEMFIVRKGLVEILVSDGSGGTNGAEEKRIYLRDGNFFGETALVIDVRRTNTVRAVTICDLNVLSKRAFNEIAAEYPEFGERMKRTVIKRQLDNMNIQSPAEKIKVQNQLSMVVEKSLKQRRMSVSLRTIYRAKKLGDKLKEIADRAAKVNVHSVRRLSRGFSGFVRPGRIGLAARGSSQRSDLLDNSGVFGNAVGGNVLSALSTVDNYGAAGRGRSPSVNRHTFTGVGDSGGLPGARRVDKVSRKLSKAELTLDLIPSALAEISAMVTQIRRTTDRLSRKLDDRSDSDQAEDDELDDDPDDDLASAMGDSLAPFGNYNGDLSIGGDSLPPISPLTEESEEEAARRESNSIVR